MSAVGRPAAHESARLHVTGAATYVDDMLPPAGTLYAAPVPAPHARARITARSAQAALALPGVVAVYFHTDIPGKNRIGPIVHDEPLLAEDEVSFRGQAVALVLAKTEAIARAAIDAVEIDYAPLEPVVTIAEAIAADQFHGEPHTIARGDLDAGMAGAAEIVSGTIASGGQDHFYLETQAAFALPGESGTFTVYSSTQHPTEIQNISAEILGISAHRVTCQVPRLGGGFGGKESQASATAAFAALGAFHTGRPVKIRLDRDQDMTQTGKRHPFWSRYRVGFGADGRIVGVEAELFSDGGWSTDLSLPVLDRALFHVDNAYFLPAVRIVGRVCKTNLPSNTAFRGFGGPQGMLVLEEAINRYAERIGADPAEVRSRSYYGAAPRDRAPYGQLVPESRSQRIWEAQSEAYTARRSAVETFNKTSRYIKRGVGYQPVKFGISFTNAMLNQAGALVLIYADGSVQLNHGGTEMGQGLYTKMIAVAADILGVPVESVRQMPTNTEKVPNTSATAASSGTDLNGAAVADACTTLRQRLSTVAATMLGVEPETLVFADGMISSGEQHVAFSKVTLQAWIRRVSLAATGFYATPGVTYDHASGSGTPFFYFAYGGSITEVEVNGLTGEHRILAADILHDVGDSLVPNIDRGQIEGAYVQGVGWLTSEEVLFSDSGRLLTHGPSTYKIPAAGDAPLDFTVSLLDDACEDKVIGGSKAVGEPPFMHGISALTALRHAIASFGEPRQEVSLMIPATPEAILRAVTAARRSEST
ncbi:MAG: xanthine dehydrogenase molybdopterin binding subunit [Myxococcota bacterium]|nr:xanthine dehydrogenase molybdopterin binding subunit [Myxococcota bacterium]